MKLSFHILRKCSKVKIVVSIDEYGQASLEYMIMLALSLGIFSAILYVSGSLLTSSTLQIGVDSAARAVTELKEAADFIYVHGHPSKTQINVYIPSNIENISAVNRTIMIRLSVGDNYTDIYSITKGNITGDFSNICPSARCHEGYYIINVESTPYEAPTWGNITLRAI